MQADVLLERYYRIIKTMSPRGVVVTKWPTIGGPDFYFGRTTFSSSLFFFSFIIFLGILVLPFFFI